MSEIKISMSITLPGSVMLTQAEAKQLEKEKTGTGFDITKLKVEDKKGNKDVLSIKTRKYKSCSQSINMSREAYDYMTSKDSCLPNIKSYVWAKMNKTQRLEAHLDLVCKALKGTSYTYKVFDD